MKNLAISFITMLCITTLTQSCEDNGPTSHIEYPNWSSEELMSNIIEAASTGNMLYKCDVDLYYRSEGDWLCYGTYPVYNNPNARADQADYILLGEDDLIPVDHVEKYGYYHRVRYRGTDMYY